jgi:hypothetical protein
MQYFRAVILGTIAFQSCMLATFAEPLKSPKVDDDKPEIHGTIVPESAGVTLGAKDFASDLPEKLRDEKVECKTATIEVDKKVKFEVTVHYDQLIDHPDFFRRAAVSMARPVPGVTVGVVFGFPTNLGTLKKPVMAVPFTLQWAGDGWLRGEQWTLFADGRLQRTE